MQCLHGDLTCRNILLNEDHSIAKIGDLGLSKMMQGAILELPVGGTLAFAAPEVLLNMRCNEKVPAKALLCGAQHLVIYSVLILPACGKAQSSACVRSASRTLPLAQRAAPVALSTRLH